MPRHSAPASIKRERQVFAPSFVGTELVGKPVQPIYTCSACNTHGEMDRRIVKRNRMVAMPSWDVQNITGMQSGVQIRVQSGLSVAASAFFHWPFKHPRSNKPLFGPFYLKYE